MSCERDSANKQETIEVQSVVGHMNQDRVQCLAGHMNQDWAYEMKLELGMFFGWAYEVNLVISCGFVRYSGMANFFGGGSKGPQ